MRGTSYPTRMARGADSSRFRPGQRNRIRDARGKLVPQCELSQVPAGSTRILRRAVRDANRHRASSLLLWFSVFLGVQLVSRVIVRYSLLGTSTPRPPAAVADPFWGVTVIPLAVGIAIAFPIALLVSGLSARRRGIRAL